MEPRVILAPGSYMHYVRALYQVYTMYLNVCLTLLGYSMRWSHVLMIQFGFFLLHHPCQTRLRDGAQSLLCDLYKAWNVHCPYCRSLCNPPAGIVSALDSFPYSPDHRRVRRFPSISCSIDFCFSQETFYSTRWKAFMKQSWSDVTFQFYTHTHTLSLCWV